MKPVVLVTGAARGIGRAIAEELVADYFVAITYLTAAEEAKEFALKYPDALVLQSDLSKVSAETVIDKIVRRFGRFDGLVNNAGAVTSTPLEDFDAEAALHVMQVNAVVPLALAAAASRHMKSGGCIVNISSVNAKFPPATAPAYAASKAALNSITQAAAKALGPQGIRVNAVAPGAIERDHAPRSEELIGLFVKDTALGHLARDDEVARTVRFLLSDAASGITGEILAVSAGYRL